MHNSGKKTSNIKGWFYFLIQKKINSNRIFLCCCNKDDPYDVECNDYNKSNALQSSLWEIQVSKKKENIISSSQITNIA